eukprot:EG_transcript_16663
MVLLSFDRKARRSCLPDVVLVALLLAGAGVLQLNVYLLLAALRPFPCCAKALWFLRLYGLSLGLLVLEMALRLVRVGCSAADYFMIPRNLYDCILVAFSAGCLVAFASDVSLVGHIACAATLPLRLWRDYLRFRCAIALHLGVEDEGESLLAAFQVPIVFHPERAPEEEETYLFPTSISSTSSVLNSSFHESLPSVPASPIPGAA